MENAVLIRNDVIVGGASSTASNVNYINEDESVTSVQETIRDIKQNIDELQKETSETIELSNYTIDIKTKGNLCFMSVVGNGNVTTTRNGWNAITTFTNKYKPKYAQNFVAINNNATSASNNFFQGSLNIEGTLRYYTFDSFSASVKFNLVYELA